MPLKQNRIITNSFESQKDLKLKIKEFLNLEKQFTKYTQSVVLLALVAHCSSQLMKYPFLLNACLVRCLEMCSNFENADFLECSKSSVDNRKNKNLCKKCGAKSFVLLQKKDSFCESCFYEYCRHKFRSTIGKSNLVPHKSIVLVAFSGGLSSSAMSDMLLDSIQTPDLHRKLHLQPSFVFVDERICFQNSPLKDDKTVPEIKRMLATGYKCFATSLEMCFQTEGKFYEQITESSQLPFTTIECQEKWLNKFNTLSSLTIKEEYVRRTRHLLIMEIAKFENCPFVFLGTSGSRLAVNLLTDISQGKGNQLHSEVSFCDDRHEVKCLKPMREFVKKEILFWNKMRNVKFEERNCLTTKLPQKSSLSKLTETFVTSLETEFPATVYTIVRTGNKLKPLSKTEIKCLLCLSQIDEEFRGSYSALEALNDTLTLSRNLTVQENENSQLCYGCKTMTRESKTQTNLIPHFIRNKQLESIKGFLLN